MFEHDLRLENACHFSRFDAGHPLSTFSPHDFQLEEAVWATAEHYFQAHKFRDRAYGEKIRLAIDARLAHKLGNTWWKRKRADWKSIRRTIMTRAMYSKCIQNSAVKQALLDTGDLLLVETSAYDHYWGIGRDQRGENMLGQVLMAIREKLRER
ncbi:NADAR family protein [Exilibacterium tricleocarpae]|uniref:NADAR family protein n=1 Tax=Exilibacterium tricleocarpae TaxID=2591008 RepID=A0A545STE5_9GAMM|nr:NADAR family protein [Exilibacterium tricleocarpae]TQV68244.1 NADAR family protein [Exilibacterium tricleocarpae]